MAFTQLSYKKFSERIHRSAIKKRIPLNALVELTYRCNFKCVHCYLTDEKRSKSEKDELKTKEIFKIINQLKDLGCFFIGFTGGEIFLRKDIFDILWYAKRKGMQLTLLTNASFINSKTADEIKKLSPHKVDITVNAINPETFDSITQVRNSYRRVFKAINLLKQRKIPLTLKSCLMQQNKEEITEINKFARSLNCIYRLDTHLVPKMDGSEQPLNYVVPLKDSQQIFDICYPQLSDSKLQLNKFKQRLKNSANVEKNRVFVCGAGVSDLVINPFGELRICPFIEHFNYDILKGSLKAGWRQAKRFVDETNKLFKERECRDCEVSEYCPRCPALSWLKYRNFTTCPPELRKAAEFYKRVFEEKVREALKGLKNAD